MKPSAVFVFFLLSLGSAGSVWNLPSFLQSTLGTATSAIPQFILDTDHPWIVQNRRKLEQLPDAKHFLCNSESTSEASDDLQPPPDLFRRLQIDNNGAGFDRPGWANALARLGEMSHCPAALQGVEELRVNIIVHKGDYVSASMVEDANPPAELPALFADVLGSMPQLEKLDWVVRGPDANQFFKDEFTERGLSLPAVRHLVHCPSAEYLVSACPGLEVLEMGGSGVGPAYVSVRDPEVLYTFLDAAGGAKNLTKFMMQGQWRPEMAEVVVEKIPNITSLGIKGVLGESAAYSWPISDHRIYYGAGEILTEFMGILSRMHNLEHLTLPYSSDLNLGFDGGAWCGNAYMGPEGEEYGRSVLTESALTTEEAGRIVLASLPSLKTLNVGSFGGNATTGENGTVQFTWPWTGRLPEWVMETY